MPCPIPPLFVLDKRKTSDDIKRNKCLRNHSKLQKGKKNAV